MIGFDYPTKPHTRKHGPAGYRNYESYRDWLRDEFTFRCVYCLQREQWYNRSGAFHIDHFMPVAIEPEKELVYTNLLYACGACNEAKGAILGIPDPCAVAFADCVRIKRDGTITALNDDGEMLLQCLRLNRTKEIQHRRRMIAILQAVRAVDPQLFQELLGFPDDLPDLRAPKRRVPSNTKPDGAKNCYFAIREEGRLPATY